MVGQIPLDPYHWVTVTHKGRMRATLVEEDLGRVHERACMGRCRVQQGNNNRYVYPWREKFASQGLVKSTFSVINFL